MTASDVLVGTCWCGAALPPGAGTDPDGHGSDGLRGTVGGVGAEFEGSWDPELLAPSCRYCRATAMVLATGLVVADGHDTLVAPVLPAVSSPPRPPLAPFLPPPAPDLLPVPAPAVVRAVLAGPPTVVEAARATGFLEPEPAPVSAPPAEGGPRPASDRGARIVVWTTWLVSLCSSSALVLAGARNVPIQEDWHVVPAVFGHQPGFWSWLWTQNNEHRVPLPKLIYVGLLRAWTDFRVGMVFNLVVLALVAAVFILAARRLRGRTRWTDAFFPLALLHLGHWENLGWSWELTFVFATALACCVLLVGFWDDKLTFRRAIVLGGCIFAIPLCGATALPFVPLVAAAHLWSARRSRGRAFWVLGGFGVATAGLIAVYFVGLKSPDWVLPSPGPGASVLTGLKVLAMSFGPAAGGWWLLSISVVVALVAGAGWVCLRARAWTALAFLVSGLGLAALIGNGRAGLLPTFGLPDRYAIVVVPVLLCVYLAYDRYGSPRSRRLGPAVVCLCMVAALPLNIADGMQFRDWYHQRIDTFVDDIEAGIPADQLASYRPIAVDREEMLLSMYLLRKAGVGPFADILDENAVAGSRVRIDGLDAGADGWVVTGDVAQEPKASTAEPVEMPDGTTSMRWQYNVEHTWAALARVFGPPQDWRGKGALEITFRGQGQWDTLWVRLAMTIDGKSERYDSVFIDDRVGVHTVSLPWNAFGHVGPDNQWEFDAPMPLDRIDAVVLIATQPGSGQLDIERLALRPGHGQLGWPLHPAAVRRSWGPWH